MIFFGRRRIQPLIVVDASFVLHGALGVHPVLSDLIDDIWTESRECGVGWTAPHIWRRDAENILLGLSISDLRFDTATSVLAFCRKNYMVSHGCKSKKLKIESQHILDISPSLHPIDALYLALSLQLNCPFWSGNYRRVSAAREAGFDKVHYVEEYQSGMLSFSGSSSS